MKPRGDEVLISPKLRDEVLSHLPDIAIERRLEVAVRYHLSTFSFIHIDYVPLAEDPGDRLHVDLVDASEVWSPCMVDEVTGDPKVEAPQYRGNSKRCWIDPATGTIDFYYESTGELVEGVTFVEDKLFEHPSSLGYISGLNLPQTIEERAIADLNDSFQVFTQDKLDTILGAFSELDAKAQ